MNNVIHARAVVKNAAVATSIYRDRPLTEIEMMEVAPSVFAEAPHESRSQRYAYIPTAEVMRGLQSDGWQPYAVVQAKVRIAEKADFTKHMIRFRREQDLHQGRDLSPKGHTIGYNVNEFCLTNSHDGSSSYHAFGGVWRTLCSNGLMVPESLIANAVIRHSGNAVQEVVHSAHQLVADFGRIDEARDGMKALQLTDGQARAFGAAALEVRFGAVDKAPITAEQVMIPRRYEDRGGDLWTRFNVAQENLVQGGQQGRIRGADGRIRNATVRAVRGIDGNKTVNERLFELAMMVRNAA